GERQVDGDGGALSWTAFDAVGAAIRHHDPVNYGQSQAGAAAALFGREERFHHVLEEVGVHADAIVTGFDSGIATRAVALSDQDASGRRGAESLGVRILRLD